MGKDESLTTQNFVCKEQMTSGSQLMRSALVLVSDEGIDGNLMRSALVQVNDKGNDGNLPTGVKTVSLRLASPSSQALVRRRTRQFPAHLMCCTSAPSFALMVFFALCCTFVPRVCCSVQACCTFVPRVCSTTCMPRKGFVSSFILLDLLPALLTRCISRILCCSVQALIIMNG